MRSEEPARVSAPVPLWRVGWRAESRGLGPVASADLAASTAGNPYDSVISRFFTVAYAGTTRASALIDLVAPLVPDPDLAKLVRKDWDGLGHLPPGTISATWRHRRRWTIGSVPAGRLPRFIDVAEPATARWLRATASSVIHAHGLASIEPDDLVGRGADRRLTRTLGTWLYYQRDDTGRHAFDGIRFSSGWDPTLEQWALFDRAMPVFVTHSSIGRADADLVALAKRFGLVFL